MTFPAATLTISAGVIIWALHFGAIYGVTALACARGWEGMVAPAIAGATGAAVLASAAVIVAGWRRRGIFEYWLSATVASFGLIAIVYEAIPILMVPICA
jgi:hypothetical protein